MKNTSALMLLSAILSQGVPADAQTHWRIAGIHAAICRLE